MGLTADSCVSLSVILLELSCDISAVANLIANGGDTLRVLLGSQCNVNILSDLVGQMGKVRWIKEMCEISGSEKGEIGVGDTELQDEGVCVAECGKIGRTGVCGEKETVMNIDAAWRKVDDPDEKMNNCDVLAIADDEPTRRTTALGLTGCCVGFQGDTLTPDVATQDYFPILGGTREFDAEDCVTILGGAQDVDNIDCVPILGGQRTMRGSSSLKSKFEVKCVKCGLRGHSGGQCRVKCYRCKAVGHGVYSCQKPWIVRNRCQRAADEQPVRVLGVDLDDPCLKKALDKEGGYQAGHVTMGDRGNAAKVGTDVGAVNEKHGDDLAKPWDNMSIHEMFHVVSSRWWHDEWPGKKTEESQWEYLRRLWWILDDNDVSWKKGDSTKECEDDRPFH